MSELRLGILGMSDGNGHPYSWSAILNGYDKENMATCPFPVIPDYLARQQWPADRLEGGRVSHIWTQDVALSRKVAKASLIGNVVEDYRDMIGVVDGILLARDDAENHYEMSGPFIEAGLPIYIDKPLAPTVADANRILDLGVRENQVFSCSALGFSDELRLTNEQTAATGTIQRIEARIGNKWATYGVHIIEPVLNLVGDQGELSTYQRSINGETCSVEVTWKTGVTARFTTTGSEPTPPEIVIAGDRGTETLRFTDAFGAFKAALKRFIEVASGRREAVSREFLLDVIRIVEIGAGGE